MSNGFPIPTIKKEGNYKIFYLSFSLKYLKGIQFTFEIESKLWKGFVLLKATAVNEA